MLLSRLNFICKSWITGVLITFQIVLWPVWSLPPDASGCYMVEPINILSLSGNREFSVFPTSTEDNSSSSYNFFKGKTTSSASSLLVDMCGYACATRYVCVCGCKYHSMHIALREQLCRAGFFLQLLHGFWILNSGHEVHMASIFTHCVRHWP